MPQCECCSREATHRFLLRCDGQLLRTTLVCLQDKARIEKNIKTNPAPPGTTVEVEEIA